MNKYRCYKRLNDMKTSGIDVSDQIKKVAGSDDVPFSVLAFIDKYSPQPELSTYRLIYEKRHRNPLYKSLVDESLSADEKAVSLSSFLTQGMIALKSISDPITRSDYVKEMRIIEISNSLKEYLAGKSESIETSFDDIRSRLKEISNVYKEN